jgi:membrane associated rhomboid family serine protease
LILPIRDHNPRSRFPVVTLGLVLANTMVFLVGLLLSPELQGEVIRRAGAIPMEITTLTDMPPANLVAPPFTVLSSMFIHGGFWHLLGNMWFLWIFGDNVEDRLGRLRFLAFYLLTGVIGAVSQCLLMPSSPVPMVGASGAVAGVLGGYVLLFPRARIVSLLFLFQVSVPAWIFLGLWFAAQLFLINSSGIAWMAHVGGFLAGLGLVRLFMGVQPVAAVDPEYIPPPTLRR